MTSVVSICNLALSNIGKDNINSLNEPTAEARACNQFYEHVRDTLLHAYPWRFARKTVALAEVANDKPGRWRCAYRLPTDHLKTRCISTQGEVRGGNGIDARVAAPQYGHAYEIEGQTLYCDLSPAYLTYTFRLTDPTRFPPLFVDALAGHLSVRLALPLTRDPNVRRDSWNLAIAMQAQAEVADANEVRETSDIESSFLQERC